MKSSIKRVLHVGVKKKQKLFGEVIKNVKFVIKGKSNNCYYDSRGIAIQAENPVFPFLKKLYHDNQKNILISKFIRDDFAIIS